MSAFICHNSHVTALAVYAARNRLLGWTDAAKVGSMLHAENVKSVNYRYGEATEPDFEICEWAAFHGFSEVQILKAACCLSYQSCEHPGWEESDACKLLDAIIGEAPADMTGYEEAAWEITPPAKNEPTRPDDEARPPLEGIPMENDLDARTERIRENGSECDSSERVIEIPADFAQAIHRILTGIWYSSEVRFESVAAARDALWYWFRIGRLRIYRDGPADVLGIVDKYKLLRVPEGETVRFVIESSDGNRSDESDGEGFEEMASHLNWHYLIFREPDDPEAAGEPFLSETIRVV